tara:strand:- start:249 stop:830 length:582 start_codon:yes stop_codon:yes gene_type:complete
MAAKLKVDQIESVDGSSNITLNQSVTMASGKTIPAANLTGTLPAISGANLTGISSAAGTSHFHAQFSADAWVNANANTKLAFNTVIENEGSDYSTTNNRYVAPATGVYYFHAMVYVAQGDTSNGIQWRKNGSAAGLQDRGNTYAAYNEQGDGDKVFTPSLVVPLSANDYVEIYTATASDYYTGHSSWGGFRIS